jgi:hypothetical protein
MKIAFKKNYRRRKKYVLLYSQGYKVHLGQKCSNDAIHRISVCVCVCFISSNICLYVRLFHLEQIHNCALFAIIPSHTCGICCRNWKRSKCWLSSFKSLKLKACEEGSTGRKQYKNVIEKYVLLDMFVGICKATIFNLWKKGGLG